MLPFLKLNKEASASAPVESVERKPDNEESEYDGMESAMEELCDAIHAREYKKAATAFRAAFDMLEMQPHEEIEHG